MNDICSADIMRRYATPLSFPLETRAEARAYARLPLTRHKSIPHYTAAVAEKLGRKWITSDLGKFGIHTTRKRLIQVQRDLKTAGKPFRAFEVLNLGRYERQASTSAGGSAGKRRNRRSPARNRNSGN
jgi:hypothetical protein